ncbi:5-oxoprolinase subunit PxpB [Marilutibacter alkalisoli]|uniref:5-oxoprolinase subunit PxpB n=1 Tax=Marilutibacter alkalisoli TaxID=2591633 RepID=A0A514BR42_9GAMM|nr:5-oxoprolinase subunit PxpB [Lysobacter alkalisoli]QDH69795.1 5-oxoprolinase subunit PxpB [Lysobacter alkalisoli]
MTTLPHIEPLADNAWLIELGTGIDDATLRHVHALAARLQLARPGWLLDLVPAYASLGVFFDPARAAPDAVHDWLREQLQAEAGGGRSMTTAETIEIPVAYGGEYGPDLIDAALELGLDPDTLVSRHASGDYTVAMIGFAPGFPYLAGLDPALALPRLETPRTCVPAGTVAIGGVQTGIYPRESPGGWRLLGRTPLQLFDAGREPPVPLQPGDRVRFVPIDTDRFERLLRSDR